jgi:phosphoribosylformylglycinamidine synthase
MSKPKVLILRTAGTNCDAEAVHAWELAGAEPQRLHVNELIEQPQRLREFAILTIPGGFSYGDDIAAGKILARRMIDHLSDPIRDFVAADRLILGICNGFQVLVKAGLLPGFEESESSDGDADQSAGAPLGKQVVTLTNNDSARFEDRWIHMISSERGCAFVPPHIQVSLPIAHGEGKLVTMDNAIRARLRKGGHIALTYCDSNGEPGSYPINPNGSEDDIAGLCDRTGRVFGLMPHPERFVYATQHPEWTRRKGHPDDRTDGRIFFETAVKAVT